MTPYDQITPTRGPMLTSAPQPPGAAIQPINQNNGQRITPAVRALMRNQQLPPPVDQSREQIARAVQPVQPGQAQEFMQPKPMQIDQQPGRFQNQYGRFRGMAQAAAPQDFSYGGNGGMGGGAGVQSGLSPQLANRLRAFREI